ncbi:MAG: protein translocase subunit SecD, partial [Mycobacterium sp.]
MASPSAPVHPARHLSVFLALLIGVYLLVFLTGDKQAQPKLGIDLQGGTRVTLTARTPDGSAPTRDALIQAQQIISARVNGLGVSGSEVIVDGENLVITVPGSDGDEARTLGQTARLYIRPVIHAMSAREAPEPGAGLPGLPGRPRVSGLPVRPGLPAAPGLPIPEAGQPGPADQGAVGEPVPQPMAPPAQPRPYPQEPVPTPTPATPTAPTPAEPAPGAPAPARPTSEGAPAPGQRGQHPDLAARIEAEKKLRQSNNKLMQSFALQIQATRCDQNDILAGNDDPDMPLVTCSQDHKFAYVLAPSIISGDQIQDASFGLDQRRGGYIVQLQFKSVAAGIWADFTASHIGTQTAFTLDSQVVSAPTIEGAITGGRTQIHGNFTSAAARQLANVLKYGSLPLSFESSEAETVSATLGLSSLKAGLIAGAIGLALVLVYSLLYYRVLGLLTALSLIATFAMVYGILVLLGRYINYTLDLAGIAGLI